MKNISHKNIKKIKVNKINFNSISIQEIKNLYRFMLGLRIYEEEIEKRYHPEDEMKCPVHFCTGQEAVPAALFELIKKNDYLYSHHRSHGYYLAKKCPVGKLISELYGRVGGANFGLAGSQDISYKENNFFSGAILAGAIGIAVGTALNFKLKKNNKNIVFTGFGDGATDQGIFWEALNYASLKKLPIIFLCENNNYSTFTSQSKRLGGKEIFEKARAFGIESEVMFGNDVVQIYKNLKKKISQIRKKNRPFLLETITYRHSGHVGPKSDEHQDYRPNSEYLFWKKNDPVYLLEKELISKKILKESYIKNLKNNFIKEIENAFKVSRKQKYLKFKNWASLNLSTKKIKNKKILTNLKRKKFDINQKNIVIKGY
jgi:pyruvate dehydrogenase E1 component alpha subunit